jgi:zinc D-Ala-D-Ala dipeptidase
MRPTLFLSVLLSWGFLSMSCLAATLPPGFVYLKNIAPTIQQDMRYATAHNFIGRPIQGYVTPQCILTLPTARALAQVQMALVQQQLSLKVYDCYRPQMAVNDFVQWSQQANQQQMQQEFYPRIDKKNAFKLGYIAQFSGHSRGSTVDLTIVPLHSKPNFSYHAGQKLIPCFAPVAKRFLDNSIDMGTGFDCLDPQAEMSAHPLAITAMNNRLLLRRLMLQYGFKPYDKEWWHFTLQSEPYPKTYFNFAVA